MDKVELQRLRQLLEQTFVENCYMGTMPAASGHAGGVETFVGTYLALFLSAKGVIEFVAGLIDRIERQIRKLDTMRLGGIMRVGAHCCSLKLNKEETSKPAQIQAIGIGPTESEVL
jgi:hypothetical protein